MFGLGHHGHHGQNPPAHAPTAAGDHQPTFKIFCKADEGYCLSVRGGNVVLAPTNPRDEHQHWFKDMRFSTNIKDEENNPAFALVNKATGLAVKHSLGQSHPVKLVPFNPDFQDESVLWTESGDVGKGFRCIRMVNNIRLNFDALNGDKDHGGVHDGTTVVLWEWAKGDNQSWKILPWGDEAYAGGSANAPRGGSTEPTVRIFCKADEGFSATVRNGTVCLAPTNPRDDHQHWIKDMRHSNRIKDEEGYPAFALVNKVTGEAIKHSQGEGHPVKLVPYNPNYQDESVLWTESRDVGAGFRCIRMVNNIYLNFDALHGDKDHGGVRDGTSLVLWKWCEGDNQRWKILPWSPPHPPHRRRLDLKTAPPHVLHTFLRPSTAGNQPYSNGKYPHRFHLGFGNARQGDGRGEATTQIHGLAARSWPRRGTEAQIHGLASSAASSSSGWMVSPPGSFAASHLSQISLNLCCQSPSIRCRLHPLLLPPPAAPLLPISHHRTSLATFLLEPPMAMANPPPTPIKEVLCLGCCSSLPRTPRHQVKAAVTLDDAPRAINLQRWKKG